MTSKRAKEVGSLVPKTTAESFNSAACGPALVGVDTAADPKPWQGSALGIGPGTSFSEIRGSHANPLLPLLLFFPRLSTWVSGTVPRAQTWGFQANVGVFQDLPLLCGHE